MLNMAVSHAVSRLPVKEQDVIRRAKEAGISDGSRPRSPGTRVENMAMVLTAVGK